MRPVDSNDFLTAMVAAGSTKGHAGRTLRELCQVLADENQKLERQVRALEKNELKHTTRADAAEEKMVTLGEVLRVLAAGVGADTAVGKKVRAEARSILERAGIKPPGTLGSSRTTKRRRRKKGSSSGDALTE